MELSNEEYNEIANLNFEKLDEIRNKIINEKDEEATEKFVASSIFQELKRRFKRSPSLEEMNFILDLIDIVKVK